MKERWEKWREDFSVWWFMLDAQQKQAVIILTVALWQGIIEVITARLKKEGVKEDR